MSAHPFAAAWRSGSGPPPHTEPTAPTARPLAGTIPIRPAIEILLNARPTILLRKAVRRIVSITGIDVLVRRLTLGCGLRPAPSSTDEIDVSSGVARGSNEVWES